MVGLVYNEEERVEEKGGGRVKVKTNVKSTSNRLYILVGVVYNRRREWRKRGKWRRRR